MTRWTLLLAVALAAAALGCAFKPATASASAACDAVSRASGAAGKACEFLSSPGKALSAGKSLLTGHLGKVWNFLTGSGGSSASSGTTAAVALAAVVAWTVGGARFALRETGKVLSETTRPQLGSTWFSGTYWRMAGIAALLTLPFLFAAAAQALIRSDLALLVRAALGYLPLAMLAVSVAAPLTMLLLAATDQLCRLVAGPGVAGGTGLLAAGGGIATTFALAGAPFVSFLIAAVATGAAVVLWIELAIREAAVYVIVLMLPLAFAALVWPARRVWAVRAVELLVALILSKFAIVAVLALGGAALGHSHGLAASLAGAVLVLLGAFSPWALLRLLPMSELAASAAGSLAPQMQNAVPGMLERRRSEESMAQSIAAGLRQHAQESNGAKPDGARAEAEKLTFGEEPSATNGAAATRDGGPKVLVGSGTPQQAPAEEESTSEARLPGLGPQWQQEDLTWQPMVLGPESFDGGAWAGEIREIFPEADSPAEDRDPLPPAQDKDPL